MSALAVGDLNADGRPDIVAADFDNDGRTDLATANSGGTASITLLDNVAAANALAPSFSVTSFIAAGGVGASIAAGDLNRDGRVDLVFGKDSTSVQSTVRNDPSTGLVAANVASLDLGGMRRGLDVHIADVNRDGIIDAVFASSTGLALNAPDPVMAPAATFPFGTVPLGTLSAAQTVTVTNNGAAPLLGAPALGGTNPNDFLVTADGCAGGGGFNGSGPCNLQVRFSPTGVENTARTATLLPSANAPPDVTAATLSGTAGTLPVGPPGTTRPAGPADQGEDQRQDDPDHVHRQARAGCGASSQPAAHEERARRRPRQQSPHRPRDAHRAARPAAGQLSPGRRVPRRRGCARNRCPADDLAGLTQTACRIRLGTWPEGASAASAPAALRRRVRESRCRRARQVGRRRGARARPGRRAGRARASRAR